MEGATNCPGLLRASFSIQLLVEGATNGGQQWHAEGVLVQAVRDNTLQLELAFGLGTSGEGYGLERFTRAEA